MSAKDKLTVQEALDVWGQKYAPPHFDLKKSITTIREAAEQLHKMNRLTLVNLIEAARELDMHGYIAHKSTRPTVVVVEKPVPVEKKLSKPDRLQAAGLGATADKLIRTEFDRAEKTTPRASETELVAIATTDLQINKIMNDTLAVVNRYRGSNHSQTAKRQEQLMGVFNKFKSQVKTPDDAMKMLNTIKAQVDTWDDSSIR